MDIQKAVDVIQELGQIGRVCYRANLICRLVKFAKL